MIEAVLFDMDGLMFDTERIYAEGWHTAAKELNFPLSETVLISLRGACVEESRKRFNAQIPGNLYDAARKIRVDYADRYIEKFGIPVKPGLLELLQWLQKEKIPAALATSTVREKAIHYLQMADVEQYFSAVICGTDISNGKPAPDIFLAAAKKLQKDPKRCVVLEDSPNGLRAAKAAGCFAIVVPDLTPAPAKEERLWDLSANTLLDVIPYLKRIHQQNIDDIATGVRAKFDGGTVDIIM